MTNETKLRIGLWDLACGAGADYRCRRLDEIITALKNENCDILLLQEVDRHIPRSGGRDIAALLAGSLEMHASFAPAIRPKDDGPGSFAPVDGSGFGNAILSRWNFLQTLNLSLGPAPGGEGEMEHRSAALAVITAANGLKLQVFSTHLVQSFGASSPHRIGQVDKLCRALDEHPGLPILGGGDFNIGTASSDLRPLHDRMRLLTPGLGPTCSLAPGEKLVFDIDHLFGRGIRAKGIYKKALPLLSDHCLVVADCLIPAL